MTTPATSTSPHAPAPGTVAADLLNCADSLAPFVGTGPARLLVADIASLAALYIELVLPPRLRRLTPAGLIASQAGDVPRFSHRSQDGELRDAFNLDSVLAGFGDVVTEAAMAEPCEKLFRRLDTWQSFHGNDHVRFTTCERYFSLPEAFDYLSSSAVSLKNARLKRLGEDYSGTLGNFRPYEFIKWLGTQVFSQQQPAARYNDTWLAITTPPPDDSVSSGEQHISLLAKLATLCLSTDDEITRWRKGFGACDLALMAQYRLLSRTCDSLGTALAADRGADNGLMRLALSQAGQARARTRKNFAALGESLFREVLFVGAWKRHKAGMLAFARTHGGIGPDLESILYARGSGFSA